MENRASISIRASREFGNVFELYSSHVLKTKLHEHFWLLYEAVQSRCVYNI